MSMTIMPYYCTDVMRQCIKKGLAENPQSFGVQAVARGMDIPVSQLSVQFADMARVRNTPQPDCFRVMLHMFTVIYLLLLPVISYNSLGLWVVPEGERGVVFVVGGVCGLVGLGWWSVDLIWFGLVWLTEPSWWVVG